MRLFQATHEYINGGRHYLPLCRDDVVFILEEHPSGWWTAQNVRGEKGIVPSTFLREFVLCPPFEVLLHEHSLILTAQRFSVDLSSHAPAPLNKGEVLLQWKTPCEKTTLAELERGIGDLLVQRETVRQVLRESLKDLERNTREPFKDEGECKKDTTFLESKLATLRQRMNLLEAHGRQLKSALRSLRDNVLLTKCSAPVKLLGHVREFLGEEAVHTSRIPPYLKFLHGQLERLHGDVRVSEERLFLLSKNIHELECSCQEVRELLSYRIGLRDAKISAFLKFWSEQAEVAKEKYLHRKLQSLHLESLRQEEELRLRQLLQKGRATYMEVEDEFRHWKEKTKQTKLLLEEKATLDQLNQAIQQLADEERVWRNKLISTRTNAQEPKRKGEEEGKE
ncbi:hypothetical protein MOQ_004076 [Trypanosoma cruzi marinkellei]|uniref:SH3 domain-containing protein n=1 Tax=Trypanosoma cruzi marinkellei TaxID=85056 RepID=K2N2C0_TRYCR|nr:hypothetical protein MOQ_004076 [Trypanosoma cruzi marinkellei]